MFNPSRDQARLFFVSAWRKQRERAVLTPLENLAAELVQLHPEYHHLLQDEETALARDFSADSGEHNPFLHLSLHLALEEQLSIDQPVGLRALFDRLLKHIGDRHEALHVVLECLGETVWQSQRDRKPPDGDAYLECVRRKVPRG
ncbi:MAG: DUF1841 family protein [Rhodocyclaceae bacterium]